MSLLRVPQEGTIQHEAGKGRDPKPGPNRKQAPRLVAKSQSHKLRSAEQQVRERPVRCAPQARLSALLPSQLITFVYLMSKRFAAASTFPRISGFHSCLALGFGLLNSTRQEGFELKGSSGRKSG